MSNDNFFTNPISDGDARRNKLQQELREEAKKYSNQTNNQQKNKDTYIKIGETKHEGFDNGPKDQYTFLQDFTTVLRNGSNDPTANQLNQISSPKTIYPYIYTVPKINSISFARIRKREVKEESVMPLASLGKSVFKAPPPYPYKQTDLNKRLERLLESFESPHKLNFNSKHL